jgi:hypothetical protein
MAAGLSVLNTGRFLPLGRFLVLISVRGWFDPRTIVRLEGLGKLKKSTSSGARTGDFPVCSIVPQPPTLPRVPTTLHTDGKRKNAKWDQRIATGCCILILLSSGQFLVTDPEVPATLPHFLRSSGSGTGSNQPREDNWGAIWMEKWQLRV